MQKYPQPSFVPSYQSATLNQLPIQQIAQLPTKNLTQPPPFRFQERNVPMDWRAIQRINISKIMKETGIEALEVNDKKNYLEHIVDCNIW